MKKLTITLSLALLSLFVNAQSTGSNYKTALGLKFYPTGVTLKHFTSNTTAIEGIFYAWNYGSRVTGLYEYHGSLTNDIPNLKYYVGGGAHIGFWNDTWKKDYPTRDNGIGIGLDGVLGLDYKFNGAPINVSIDWQPSVNLTGYSYSEFGWGGLAIRYTF